jgi:hypothetical protein
MSVWGIRTEKDWELIATEKAQRIVEAAGIDVLGDDKIQIFVPFEDGEAAVSALETAGYETDKVMLSRLAF